MEALDEIRREVWREARQELQAVAKQHPEKPGIPRENDPDTAIIQTAREKAEEIRNSDYTHGKVPESLTEKPQIRLAMIAENNSRLYRACCLKETSEAP